MAVDPAFTAFTASASDWDHIYYRQMCATATGLMHRPLSLTERKELVRRMRRKADEGTLCSATTSAIMWQWEQRQGRKQS